MTQKNSLLRGITIAAFFAFGVFSAQDYDGVIRNYFDNAGTLKSVSKELKDFKIINTDQSASLKGTIVNVQQKYNGIPIYNSVSTLLLKDNSVVFSNENFQHNLLNKEVVNTPKLDSKTVFSKVIGEMGIENNSKYSFAKNSENFINAQLVYFSQDGKLILAYEINFEQLKSANYWNIVADANTGKILLKNNLTVSCNFQHGAYQRDGHNDLTQQNENFISKINNSESSAKVVDNATYNIFPLPIEAPSFGGRSLVSNPWDLTSSPQGWHSDGTTSYTISRGNNVYAYDDSANTDTVGPVADGGATRNFDFPLDLSLPVSNYTDASITNLFYVNNKVHDIFYKFGFNEVARNFQQNNFGKGGTGNDYVQAEARDGGGTNNANFYTPMDGANPRMQMYLWDPANIQRLFYNSPADMVSRTPVSLKAEFGPQFYNVTSNVLLAAPLDGCTALTNTNLTGKIALIERGTCGFVVKVKNAQLAGAVGAIVYNLPTSSATSGMAGTDATITIPSVLIDATEGPFVRNLINSGTNVNATIKDDNPIYLDGSFDNGIITHEYGHGISNRLTGNGYSCLSSTKVNEQMGEGWSDFFALMLTNKPGDNASVGRGIGTYAIAQPTSGGGIRPAKYSPDFTVNGYTYGKTNGMTYVNAAGTTVIDVHSIGFIWATMLWDLHWKYVEKYGYNSDVTADKNSGSARVLQMVVNGLKLQGCNPTFIKGRDAIIAADLAATGGVDKCMIWNVFAKRGLGVKASPGKLTGVTTGIKDQVEDFTVPTECSPLATSESSLESAINIYPNPAKNEFFIKQTTNKISGKAKVSIYDLTGKLVSESMEKLDNANPISTNNLQTGTYIIKVEGIGVKYSSKLIIKK